VKPKIMLNLSFRINTAILGLTLLAGTFTTPVFASQKSIGTVLKNGAGKICNLYTSAAGSNTIKDASRFVGKIGPEGKITGTAVQYANPKLAGKLNPYCWIKEK